MDELMDKNLPYFVGGNLATLSGTGVQPSTQPKDVLGWAWKGSGLGSESDSVETPYKVGGEDCRLRKG